MDIIPTKTHCVTFQFSGYPDNGYTMPRPTRIWLTNRGYIVQYDLNGYFATLTALKFLNDVISRFCLTFGAKYLDFNPETEPDTDNGLTIELKELANGLEKLKRRVATFSKGNQIHCQDRLFGIADEWCQMKMRVKEPFTELDIKEIIRQAGGTPSECKCKAKSMFRYYRKNGFKPNKRTHEMSRSENAKKQAAAKAQKAKAAVLSTYTSMQFLGEKTTVTAVSKNAGVDRKTAGKYLKELKEEGLI